MLQQLAKWIHSAIDTQVTATKTDRQKQSETLIARRGRDRHRGVAEAQRQANTIRELSKRQNQSSCVENCMRILLLHMAL